MRYLALALVCAAVGAPGGAALARQAGAANTPVPATAPAVPASGAPYDVFVHVLSEPQRKMLDRDSRCSDARQKTDAFVASDGKELQTGVDAMAALEKCATMSRVGDWADFRDYVITAASAVAYRVGISADDQRLLHRAVDDASHVNGYDASAANVASYGRASSEDIDSNDGHKLREGPPQSTRTYVRDNTRVAADHGAFGSLATAIGEAATTALAARSTPRAQQ